MKLKKSETNLNVINNFILYFTSSEEERKQMYQCAIDYIEEDWVDGKEAEDDSPEFTVSEMKDSFQAGQDFRGAEEEVNRGEIRSHDIPDCEDWLQQTHGIIKDAQYK
jgi:hypothetical protein